MSRFAMLKQALGNPAAAALLVADRAPTPPAIVQAQAPAPVPAAAPAPLPAAAPAASEEDMRAARQKAAFCYSVFYLAEERGISIDDACAVEATNTGNYPDLLSAGKGGASLLAGSRGVANYRAWVAKLGRIGGPRSAPNASNFSALLPKFVGSRPYVRPGPDAFWVALARVYENENKVDLQNAYRLVLRLWPADQTREGLPTYDQAKHYYANHRDQKELMVARMGVEWARNNLIGHIIREAPPADDVWVGDHHIFDCPVRVWDQENCRWRAVRPWLTAWADWGTWSFVGWQIRAIAPNRDSIERALRDGLTKNHLHPPRTLYIDNGKDYKAMGFARSKEDAQRDAQRLDTVASLLGCQVCFANPYNARAKVVERMFREVCAAFSKLCPGYRGNCPGNRPEHAQETWDNPDGLPTLEDFTRGFEAWLATEFHERNSEAKGLDGKTPNAARASFTRPRPALDPLAFHRAFLRPVPSNDGRRKIMRGGRVQAVDRVFESEALFLLLGNVEEVVVKLDPDDVSCAYVFHLDGREIGLAREVKTVAPMLGLDADPESIEDLRDGLRQQGAQMRSLKQASAGARGLPRFSSAPVGTLAHVEASAVPAPAPRLHTPGKAPAEVAPAEVVADFAAIMAASTRSLLPTSQPSQRNDE